MNGSIAPFFVIAAVVAAFTPDTSLIVVDRDVHVSTTQMQRKIGETVLSAHPTDPGRLVGAAMVWIDGALRRGVVVYTSRDGGMSWQERLSTESSWFDAADPAVAFAPDGRAYLVVLAKSAWDARVALAIYRSDDGGIEWTEASRTVPGMSPDRPFAAVDRRPPHALYVNAVGALRRTDGLSLATEAIFVSLDMGKSLSLAAMQPVSPPATIFANGPLVQSSTGVPISVYTEAGDLARIQEAMPLGWGHYPTDYEVKGTVSVVRGSRWPRLDLPQRVSSLRQVHAPFEGQGPSLAIDASGGPFNDRLYVVWPDRRSGRARILSSFSSDTGKAWSTIRTVDDEPQSEDVQHSPNNFMPAAAVNRDGVIGAMWYDRRHEAGNAGWTIRFAASIDGGETWTRSVAVASRANKFDEDGVLSTTVQGSGVAVNLDDRQFYAGDTAGIAASSDGAFHLLWIDNRTGLPQAWSTRIGVHARAVRNGSDALKDLRDVSADIRVMTTQASYERGIVKASLTLTSTSDHTIRPECLRVVVIESALGVPELIGTDNGATGTGAIWKLSPYLAEGQLAPGETSRPLSITCQLRNRRPIREGNLFRYGLLRMETVVLASAQ